jgi:hypothetical protein
MLWKPSLTPAISTYFVTWMPLPGSLEALPSLIPLVLSLAAQVPFFGIATLALLARPRIARYLAVAATIPLMIVYDLMEGRVGVLIVLLILIGLASIWFSYRRWCAMELD